jgi:hypothetical protein
LCELCIGCLQDSACVDSFTNVWHANAVL